MGSRTVTQVRTHAQKYFLKLAKQTGAGVGKASSDLCPAAGPGLADASADDRVDEAVDSDEDDA